MTKTRKSLTLHIGCGKNKVPGSIGVDLNPKSNADIIHNLNRFPYPFPNNRFDQIMAFNIIEHLDDIVKVMEEIYRIAKIGAKVYITTGHFSSLDSFTDPTHKHFFTSRTLDYFIPGTHLYKYDYSEARYKKIRVWIGPEKNVNPLLKFILTLINKNVVFYEKRFAFIFPVGCISYELEVIKSR